VTGAPTRLPLTVWVLLRATGWLSTLPLLALAAAITLIFPDGEISRLGPFPLMPTLRVLVIVPVLLGVAVGVAHATARTPVVFRNGRVLGARAISYAVTSALAAAIVLLGTSVGPDVAAGASIRNLLLMSGLCAGTAALAGVVYAFVPGVLAFAAAVLSGPGESDWTPWALLFRESASGAQLVVASAVAVAGVGLAVLDPRSPGYLRDRGLHAVVGPPGVSSGRADHRPGVRGGRRGAGRRPGR